jgi:hypothetical protein
MRHESTPKRQNKSATAGEAWGRVRATFTQSLALIEVDAVQNLHTLDGYGGPLGVECRCGRRALVPPEALGARAGNMREIRSLRFACGSAGRDAGAGSSSAGTMTRWDGRGGRALLPDRAT